MYFSHELWIDLDVGQTVTPSTWVERSPQRVLVCRTQTPFWSWVPILKTEIRLLRELSRRFCEVRSLNPTRIPSSFTFYHRGKRDCLPRTHCNQRYHHIVLVNLKSVLLTQGLWLFDAREALARIKEIPFRRSCLEGWVSIGYIVKEESEPLIFVSPLITFHLVNPVTDLV